MIIASINYNSHLPYHSNAVAYIYSFFVSQIKRLTGEHWKSRRRLLTPAFHIQILDSFMDVFNDKSIDSVKKIEQTIGEHGSREIDIFPFATKCSFDMICGNLYEHNDKYTYRFQMCIIQYFCNTHHRYFNGTTGDKWWAGNWIFFKHRWTVSFVAPLLFSFNLYCWGRIQDKLAYTVFNPWFRIPGFLKVSAVGREMKKLTGIVNNLTKKVVAIVCVWISGDWCEINWNLSIIF